MVTLQMPSLCSIVVVPMTELCRAVVVTYTAPHCEAGPRVPTITVSLLSISERCDITTALPPLPSARERIILIDNYIDDTVLLKH